MSQEDSLKKTATQQSHEVTLAQSDPEKGDGKVSLSSDEEAPKQQQQLQQLSPMHPSQFPDGGLKAWLCVAGGAACLFCSFGWINCIGVFQDYYDRVPLHNYSSSTVGWIPSCEVFFMLFCGPFIGKIFDTYGPRQLIFFGTILHVFGLMMASISTKYYQFLLSQGVCSAIGASMIFNPAMTCTATWFFKRRGLAIGLIAAGSSLGGVLFPIIVSRLVPRVGFGWAMRTCAFLILALMIFANLTLRSRIPPPPPELRRSFSLATMARPLKETPFLLLTLGVFFFYYGMFIPFSFIVSDAHMGKAKMSLVLSQYLVSIINAGSIFGRTLPGYIGDKVGRFNTMVVMCIFTGVLVLALWIPSASNAALFVFAPFFGFASGAAIGLTPALIAQISDVKEIGVRTGTVFGIASIAALTGPPIGGALIGIGASTGQPDFIAMKIFCGVFCLFGSAILVAARLSLSGMKLNVKV